MSQTSQGRPVIISGRIVWTKGKLFEGEKEKIYGTNQPKIGKDGEQNTIYGFGLAVSKADLADPAKAGQLLAAMQAEALSVYSSGQIPQGFAWKYKDGDGVDDKGKPFALREGYQGCYVFTMTTMHNIRFFRWENGAHLQVADGIKCGDYINCQVMVKAQVSAKPGLYLNPMMVQLAAPGKEIINAPSADAVFGDLAPQAPAGYIPPPAPPQMPMMPTTAVVPHYGVVPAPLQPTAPGFAPSVAVPLPGANPHFPAPAVGVPQMMPTHPGMPGPTGYPPVSAPMAVSPTSPFPGIR